MFPLPRGWPAQDTPRREHGHGLSSGQDTAPHSHPSSCLEATRRDQARSSRLSNGTSPLHIPLQGCPIGHLHPAMQKTTPVRMKGPCTDSGAQPKSMPGDPECLIPPLPSDCLSNLDLQCRPFHPPAPTPDSSPERRK